MKKTLILALLVLLCATAAYAADNALKATAIPYAFQITTSSASGEDDVLSNYGLGAEVTYQRAIAKGFFLEAGVGNSYFFLKGDRPVFASLLAFAGAGYRLDIDEKFSMDIHADMGADMLFYNGKFSTTFTMKAGLGAALNIRKNLDLRAGVEGTIGFAKDSSANYVNYRIYPVVGVSYEF